MNWPTIEKRKRDWKIIPNLSDYEKTVAAFSWETARRELNGLPHAPGLNIAYEAVDRHAAGQRGEHLALRWLSRHGEQRDFTYDDFRTLTNQFANVLKSLGVGKGDRVFVLAGRIPELYVSALGTLKNGSVFCPLFSAFGPEPVRQRLTIGDGKVLVTTATLYKRKVAEIRSALPTLEHVLLVGSTEETAAIPGAQNFQQLMDAASPEFTIAPTGPEDLALLHFTSGTTGKPKGAMHVHNAVIAHHMTGTYALDFHPNDVFWCTADPGWVTGTSYGIIAPLTHGITSIIDEADFDAERWYGLLQAQKVTIWYTAPTAVRMMMKVGTEIARKYELPALRFIASVGVAISLRQGGLIAPAMHNVDKKSLDEIMAGLRDLVKRTRAGVLRSSEISEATITVTSLGEQGVETVFGVIYPPQVALVGFGKIVERPWAINGMVGARPVMMATLAADHRASDGHRGGLFLAAIERLLQEPEKL